MNVAVITSYDQEPRETLERCIASVKAQSVPAVHILVADGTPQEWIDDVDGVRHIRLDRRHEDHPLAPFSIGATIAAGEDFDAIGQLDADATLDEDYVQACTEIAEREYQLHFVLVDGYPDPAAQPGEDPRPGNEIGSLFVLRRGYPALPGLALIPTPLALMRQHVILEKFRILEYHGVATDRPLVMRPNNVPVPIDEIQTWWSALTDQERALIERHVGGAISFTA